MGIWSLLFRIITWLVTCSWLACLDSDWVNCSGHTEVMLLGNRQSWKVGKVIVYAACGVYIEDAFWMMLSLACAMLMMSSVFLVQTMHYSTCS